MYKSVYIHTYGYKHIYVCIYPYTCTHFKFHKSNTVIKHVETTIRKGNQNFRLYKISILPMNYEAKTVDLFLTYGGNVCCTDKAWYQFLTNSVMIIEKDMFTSTQPSMVLILC